MATNVTRIQFNNLTIEPGSPYTITKDMEGLTGLPVRISQQIKTGASGGNIYKTLDGMRTISFEGRIIASDVNSYFNAHNALLNAFFTENNALPLTIRLWDGSEKLINCFVTEQPFIVYRGGESTTSTYRVELKAADPYFTDLTVNSGTTQLALAGGAPILEGLPLPFPLSIGSSGQIILNNNGDVPVYPKIIINGSVTNPAFSITNSAGTFYVSFNTTLLSSDILTLQVINNNISVTKNGESWLQFMEGDLPELQLGSNILTYTSAIYDSTSTLYIEFFNKYRQISDA